MQQAVQFVECRSRSQGEHLDAPVGEILRITPQPEPDGFPLDKVAEADALDASRNQGEASLDQSEETFPVSLMPLA